MNLWPSSQNGRTKLWTWIPLVIDHSLYSSEKDSAK
jgi:hypothetical protein